jgi:hypothetical protein
MLKLLFVARECFSQLDRFCRCTEYVEKVDLGGALRALSSDAIEEHYFCERTLGFGAGILNSNPSKFAKRRASESDITVYGMGTCC